MIRINNIKLNLDESIESLKFKISKKLKINSDLIQDLSIFKESIDARKKSDIQFVYSVDFSISDKSIENVLLKKYSKELSLSEFFNYTPPKKGDIKMQNPPIIVGFGPCGLFSALTLAKLGYNPIVLEQGKDVDQRSLDVDLFWNEGILNPNSNVQFGEGGAGSFSDGKLTTRIKDPLCHEILHELVECGAPKNILYMNKPHVGTDILKNVIKNIRKKIISLGAKVYFDTKVEDFIIENQKIQGVITNSGEIFKSNHVVLALGHSSRETFKQLHKKGVAINSKPFAIGVRIEHPQILINKAQYKEFYNHPRLSSAEYKLTHQTSKKRSVYTFCMCPGGEVIGSSSSKNELVVNGMSYHDRSNINANSALLVNVTTEDFQSSSPIAGILFQENIEKKAFDLGGKNYKVPVQRVEDFLSNKKSSFIGSIKPSHRFGYTLSNLNECLPDFICESLKEGIIAMGKKLKGFDHADAILTGVETRSSSPIRIPRDSLSLESINTIGLYPAGEGAGYAGGIVSAAVDGIKVSESIISNFFF